MTIAAERLTPSLARKSLSNRLNSAPTHTPAVRAALRPSESDQPAPPEFFERSGDTCACPGAGGTRGRLSFREVVRIMNMLLPSNKSSNHTSVRRRLARMADRLKARDDASAHRMSLAHGSPMVVSIDGAHIQAVPGFQTPHFEVTTGRVEAQRRPARHFAVAPNLPAAAIGRGRDFASLFRNNSPSYGLQTARYSA